MKTAQFPRICLARRAALALSLATLPALSSAQGLPLNRALRDESGEAYVIPWSSIPKERQEPLHRYVSEAEGKLCGY